MNSLEDLSIYTNKQLKELMKQYDVTDSDIDSDNKILKIDRIKYMLLILNHNIALNNDVVNNNISLNEDILFNIMLWSDSETIKNIWLTHKHHFNLHFNLHFWINKFNHDNLIIINQRKSLNGWINEYRKINNSAKKINTLMNIPYWLQIYTFSILDIRERIHIFKSITPPTINSRKLQTINVKYENQKYYIHYSSDSVITPNVPNIILNKNEYIQMMIKLDYYSLYSHMVNY